MKKILIFAVFPAPYRTVIFNRLSKEYDIKVFFERNSDANRDPSWFDKEFKYNYRFLSEIGKKQSIKQIKKDINTFDLVCIYDFSSLFALKVIHLCKKNSIRYIINCDGSFDRRSFLIDMIKKYIVKDATLCMASGACAKKYFLNHGADERNIVIHNFSSINKKEILNSPLTRDEKNVFKKKIGIDLTGKLVLSVGQFTHRKGYDLLLKAWKSVPNSNTLIIIGGGEEGSFYRKFIVENEMHNVFIIDYLSKSELMDYYKASDIFILPTREDIWGLVINEALSFGIPTITTNRCIAGLEMIKEGINGSIIKVEDVDSIVNSLQTYIKLDAETLFDMGLKGIAIAKNYTVENMSDIQINAINNILK